MSKQSSYKLSDYIKAIDILSIGKFGKFIHREGKGSAYHFEIYEKETDTTPCNVWNVHYSHDRKKEIWSKQDLKKAATYLCVDFDRFIETIEKLK